MQKAFKGFQGKREEGRRWCWPGAGLDGGPTIRFHTAWVVALGNGFSAARE
jgi:hypothetical protein